MTQVWVVVEGMDHEGGSVLSVHATQDGANRAAEQAFASHGYGTQVDEFEQGIDDDGLFYGHAYCFYTQVERHEVVS